MDIREEFEAYIAKKYPGYPSQLWREGDEYVYTNEAWQAYQAGRRAGQEDMRERAAKACLIGVKQRHHYDGPKKDEFDVRDNEVENCVEIIRQLPVEGE